MTLAAYFTRAFVGRFCAVLFGLGALLQLLDLMDKMGDVLERGHGTADLLSYVVLRLPLILNQLVPLAVLIGALLAFMSFAQRGEVIALRSIGASSWRLFATLLPAVAAIVALHFVLMDQLAPRAEQALQAWWEARPAPPSEEAKPAEPVWMRAGSSIVAVRAVRDDGRRLEGVTIVRRDELGRATARLVADEARWADGGWVLHDVDAFTLRKDTQSQRHDAVLPWPDGPAPENVAFVADPTEFLSIDRLRTIVEGVWSGTRDVAFYEVQVQRIFSIPASSFVMLLLAQPALHGMRRSRGFGAGMAAGLALGLLFMVFQGLLSAFAEADLLPPLLAVWFPLAIFALIGGAILLYLEE
ncbi:LPS export ABC transporter permease LptG [Azospirillum sp. ST 5-10]|uniref:LPS export ABC transporter permease LptG n=1 Tax=unclassified Azospirillum TaxID=2630922 RepID=UPI003F49F2AE